MRGILEVCEVKISYRMGKVAVPALHGVSFKVEEGEFLTIFAQAMQPQQQRSGFQAPET